MKNKKIIWLLFFTIPLIASSQVRRQVGQSSAGRLYSMASMSQYHTIFIDAGDVWGFGQNSSGQVTGQPTQNEITAPTFVADFDAIQVATGISHTLVLTDKGEVWAWGTNSSGEIGNGMTSDSEGATKVPLSNVISVAAGYHSSFAISADGSVWVWGENTEGQLGIGNNTDQVAPVKIPSLENVIAVDAGAYHTVALKADGTVWVWGSNSYYQLGQSSNNVLNPVQLASMQNVINIACGELFTVALKADGTVWNWGDYGYDPGQIGPPVQVPGTFGNGYLSNIVQVSAGQWHALAVSSSGTAFEFPALSGVTEQVNQISSVTAVMAGGEKYLAIDVTGKMYEGKYVNSVLSFTNIHTLSAATLAVSSGASHSLALQTDGKILSWGYNISGQLGNGTTTDKDLPQYVRKNWLSYFTDVVAIAGGGLFSVALKADGTAYAWGDNFYGQLGNGNNSSSNYPVQVSGLINVVAVAASTSGGHALALKSDGTVWAWGYNSSGQLGNGTNANSNVPKQVTGLTNVIAIAAGQGHSLALLADGTVRTWGENYNGQLGNGDSGLKADKDVPVPVPGLNSIVAIAGGGAHSLALRANGKVYAWGMNQDGQLGTGNNISSTSPLLVMMKSLIGDIPLSAVKAIGGGSLVSNGDNSIALRSNGTVWTWGGNLTSELAISSSIPSSNVAVKASDIEGVVAVSNVAGHSIVNKSSGVVCAAGYNLHGQLGNGAAPTGSGVYTCGITSAFSESLSSTMTVEETTTSKPTAELTLFPNPVLIGSDLRISFRSRGMERSIDVAIIDNMQQVVFQKQYECIPGDNTILIPTSGLKKGLYIVRVGNENVVLVTK